MNGKRWATLTIMLALLLTVAFAVAACGSSTSSSTTSGALSPSGSESTTSSLPENTTAGSEAGSTTSEAAGGASTTVAGITSTTAAGGAGSTESSTTTTMAGSSTTMASSTTTTMAGTSTTVAGSTSTTSGTSTSVSLPNLKGQNIEVAAVWTDGEENNFKLILDEFTKLTGATVTFTSTGNDIATVLGTRLQGKNPPDVAILPQPGLLRSLVSQNALQPLDPVLGSSFTQAFAPVWKDLGTVNGKQYGLVFKAANKSTVWYSVEAFKNAGITAPPATWDELLADAGKLSSSGITPFSIGGADGWTLTDWFENVYLKTAGADMYNKLAQHQIPWTDPSVTTALNTLAQIFGKSNWIAGGNQGALQVTFPKSVDQVFGTPQKAAIVYEADFVAGTIASDTKAKLGVDANYFPFPTIGNATGGTSTTAAGGTSTTAAGGTTTTVAGGSSTTMAGSSTTMAGSSTTMAAGGSTSSSEAGSSTTTSAAGGATTSSTMAGATPAPSSVEVGGDTAVLMKNSEGGKALIQFLSTAQAAEIWVAKGGFTSPNKNVPASAYPDPVLAKAAQDIQNATTVVFDMSDQAPPAFGGTPAQGEWKLLQDFLANPSNVQSIQQQLESAAKAAYGK